MWRIHHDGPEISSGSRIELEAQERHHVQRVLRLRTGARVGVFDGQGAEWWGTLEESSPSRVIVRIGEVRRDRVEPSLAVHLFPALCRQERVEWLIQKAAEIGAAGIHFCATERAARRAPTPRQRERWRRVALEACKQSGRRRIPEVEVLPGLVGIERRATLGILLDTAAEAPLLDTFLAGPPPEQVWIAAGPEGGFSPDECLHWAARGWRPAGLGPRTLRVETATLVSAAIVLHAWGDLGRPERGSAGRPV